MRKLGYIRTSTNKQLIDRQVDQLETICDEIFIEDGVSACGKHRPVYDRVMREIQAGDVFVVLSLDRAYRSVIDALTELEHLHERGAEFYCLQQSFDTRTAEGRLLYTICAALAEWERMILSKRTREGMQAARRRGSVIGRPRKLTKRQIAWAREQIKEASRCTSIAELSGKLDVSSQTLRRALSDGDERRCA